MSDSVGVRIMNTVYPAEFDTESTGRVRWSKFDQILLFGVDPLWNYYCKRPKTLNYNKPSIG